MKTPAAMSVTPQTTFVDVAGKKTQVTCGGRGAPLLYLHSAAGETDWMPFHDRLAEHHTVYVPAHPGFALSEGLDAISDMTDLVWHTVDLLDALQLGAVPVVGLSLGAWLGVELAIVRPQRVQRLVLTAAAGLRLEDAPMAELFIDDLQALRELLFFDPQGEAVTLAMPTSLDDDRILHWIRAREATARLGWNPYLHNPRLAGHLRRVACPTLVLWGEHDRLIPPAHGAYYARHIPQAELKTFAACGHMVPFEQPADFVRCVNAFLAAK